jgi:hypothetical protein
MNMSYCRFENTYNDLIDCIENMSKESSNDRDERYRERLLLLMKNTVESGEVDEILEEIEDNRQWNERMV